MRAAALCLIALGCGNSDPCSGQPALCIAVEVHGASLPLDEIALSVTAPASRAYQGGASGKIDLPVQFAALLPDDLSGPLRVELIGRRAGAAVSQGGATLTVPPSGQRLRIELAPLVPDGGSDGAIDLSSPDLSSRDLSQADRFVADLSSCPDGRVACNNACVDFTNDPHNCGSCGHDCQGGTCMASQCQPKFLVTNLDFPGGIAVDSANLYWADSSGLNQVPLGGGMGTPLGNLSRAWGLALTGTTLYATDFQLAVWSVATSGGSAAKVADSSTGLVLALAADSTNVYFTTWDNGAGGTVGVVEQAPIGGGGPTLQINTLDYGGSPHAPVSPWPFNLAVAGGYVYWTNPGGGDSLGMVMRAPIGGGPSETLFTSQPYPWAIAVDANHVYWTNLGTEASGFADGAVMKAPLAGGTATFLVASLTAPNTVAVDASDVYFSSGVTAVSRVAISGGNPTFLGAVNGISPVNLAVDATCVYWSGGAIVKLAK